jgi:hypothetical protein
MSKLCRVTMVALFLLAGAPLSDAQQAPDLRGVWKLVSYTRDGKVMAMDAQMIITAKYYSRVSAERNRRQFDGFDFRRDKLTDQQARLVADTFPQSNSSAGTYRLEGDLFYFKTPIHQNPGAIGKESDRRFQLHGDRLLMSAEAGSGYVEEVWERVEKF